MKMIPFLAVLAVLGSCAAPQVRPPPPPPPDLQAQMQSGAIEVVVQKLHRTWAATSETRDGAESLKLKTEPLGYMRLSLHSTEELTPFLASLGALMFFTERFPGTTIECEEPNGKPSRCTGTLALPGAPPTHIEVRSWVVPGTETVAVLTGLWPDGPDTTWLQDLEAVTLGTRAAPKTR